MKIKCISFYLGIVSLMCVTSLLLLSCMGCGGAKKEDNYSKDDLSNITVVEDQNIKKGKTPAKTKDKKTTSSFSVDYNIDSVSNTISRLPRIVLGSSKIFDISKFDPFKRLNHQIKWKSDDGFTISYVLQNPTNEFNNRILNTIHTNKDALPLNDELYLISELPKVEFCNDLFAIAYTTTYYSNEEDVLGGAGEVKIFDPNGNLIRRLIDTKYGFDDIRISQNGEYLLQKFGVSYGEDGSGQTDVGFRFYNINNGNLIFEKNCGKDQYIEGYDFFEEKDDGHYAIYYRSEGNDHEYFLIDLKSSQVYFKVMDRHKYFNQPSYRSTLMPEFLKNGNIESLLIDGFKQLQL